jgi:hypothetical protein
MNKSNILNTVIGLSGIYIQTSLLLPWHEKISGEIKNLEARVDQTNQILKEERQTKGREFKDL